MNYQLRITRAYNERYSLMLPLVSQASPGLEHTKKVAVAKKMAVLDEVLSLQNEGVKIPVIFKSLEEMVDKEVLELDGVRRLTYTSFRQMVRRARNEGVKQYAKSGKIGNQNAAKHKEDKELVGWVHWLRFSSKNLSNEHIKRIIRHNCLLNGKTIPSDGWINTILADGHIKSLASTSRYDRGNRHQQRYNSVLYGLRAPMANDRWEADGTRVNLMGWQEDVNGRKVTTFLYVVFVQDNHSGEILGWQFTTSQSPENRWAYMAALKMAVNRTGCLPANLALDRFPGHNTPEWQDFERKCELLGCRFEYTDRAEGKQHLERSIGTFQSVFLSQSDYYYGEGVKSSRQAAHRPLSYLKEAGKQQKALGLGFKQMAEEAERFIIQYNTTKLTEYGRKTYARLPYSPAELYQQSDAINTVKIAAWQIADLFWLSKVLKLSHRVLKHEVLHELCIYPVIDYKMLSYLETSKRALIRYEADDLSMVYVFDVDTNQFLGTIDRQEQVVTRGDFADGRVIGRYKATQKQIEEKRLEEMSNLMDDVDETSLSVYWGKEAKYRAEESVLDFARTDRYKTGYGNPSAGSGAEELVPVSSSSLGLTKPTKSATVKRDIYDDEIPLND